MSYNESDFIRLKAKKRADFQGAISCLEEYAHLLLLIAACWISTAHIPVLLSPVVQHRSPSTVSMSKVEFIFIRLPTSAHLTQMSWSITEVNSNLIRNAKKMQYISLSIYIEIYITKIWIFVRRARTCTHPSIKNSNTCYPSSFRGPASSQGWRICQIHM